MNGPSFDDSRKQVSDDKRMCQMTVPQVYRCKRAALAYLNEYNQFIEAAQCQEPDPEMR